jgi:hypothetical protein
MSQETVSSDPFGEKLGEKSAPPPPGPRAAKTDGTAAPIRATGTMEIKTAIMERRMIQVIHAKAEESSQMQSEVLVMPGLESHLGEWRDPFHGSG